MLPVGPIQTSLVSSLAGLATVLSTTGVVGVALSVGLKQAGPDRSCPSVPHHARAASSNPTGPASQGTTPPVAHLSI